MIISLLLMIMSSIISEDGVPTFPFLIFGILETILWIKIFT